MGLNERKRWKAKAFAVDCMDVVPALRHIITKVMSPLYPLPNYDELLDKAFVTFNEKISGGGRYTKANQRY